MKQLILLLARLIVGGTFVFSGFVKAVDPLGFTYKIEDYLQAMGPFMEQFIPLAFIASILLIAVEFVIGVSLVFGVRFKEAAWAGAAMMLVMTPLTLWIALKNPVTDCGCFGDALVISNWTTFWKNIVLDMLLVLIFWLMKHHKSRIGKYVQWVIAGYAFVFACGVSVYALNNLPPIDFRPYKIGNNLLKEMEIPEGAPVDSFDVKLIYAKDGVEQEFTMDNYPKNDKSWTFVDQKTVLVKEGFKPPIHDFVIDTENGEITDIVLENPSYSFLLISYDLAKADLSKADKLNEIYEYAVQNDYYFIMLTASTGEEIEAFKAKTGASYPVGTTDKITLKTIIRANPGLLLLKDATVLNKWHSNHLPEFKEKLENSDLGSMQMPNTSKRLIYMAIILLLPIVIILAINSIVNTKKRD